MLASAVCMQGYFNNHFTGILFTGENNILHGLSTGQLHIGYDGIISHILCAFVPHVHVVIGALYVEMHHHGYVAFPFFPGGRHNRSVSFVLACTVGVEGHFNDNFAGILGARQDNIAGNFIFGRLYPAVGMPGKDEDAANDQEECRKL